jgi:hypothetical protein
MPLIQGTLRAVMSRKKRSRGAVLILERFRFHTYLSPHHDLNNDHELEFSAGTHAKVRRYRRRVPIRA